MSGASNIATAGGGEGRGRAAGAGDSPKHRQNTAARVRTEQSLTNECRGGTAQVGRSDLCPPHTRNRCLGLLRSAVCSPRPLQLQRASKQLQHDKLHRTRLTLEDIYE